MPIQQMFLRSYGGGGGGPRGIWGGGQPSTAIIDFVTISTLGNATSFGSLITNRRWIAGCSNGTRGLFGGGYNTNQIQYITCATEGNGTDFGDLTVNRYAHAGLGNATRGLFGGDDAGVPDGISIDYVTIASLGNASSFGDMTEKRYNVSGCASATRGLFVGGYVPSPPTWASTKIDYVTISSTGNATDYGDLQRKKYNVGCVDNDTRACFGGGGWQPGPAMHTNEIGYVTIANTGNATDYGDLTVSRKMGAGTNDKTVGVDRGCFGGGFDNTSWINTIDYITISNTGNAQDFGDLTLGRFNVAGVSGGDAA